MQSKITMPKILAHETPPSNVTSSVNVLQVMPFLFTSKMASAAPHMFIAPDGNTQERIHPGDPPGTVMRTAIAGTIVMLYAKQPTIVAVIDFEKNVESQKFHKVRDATQNE